MIHNRYGYDIFYKNLKKYSADNCQINNQLPTKITIEMQYNVEFKGRNVK